MELKHWKGEIISSGVFRISENLRWDLFWENDEVFKKIDLRLQNRMKVRFFILAFVNVYQCKSCYIILVLVRILLVLFVKVEFDTQKILNTH